MWLLDTVAISETAKPNANPGFLAWLGVIHDTALFTSVLCLGEVRRGVAQLASGKKRDALDAWLSNDLPGWFGDRILEIDREIALIWGDLGVRAAVKPIDALIGATAKAKGLAVVTRNVRDFDGLGVPVVNPWTD